MHRRLRDAPGFSLAVIATLGLAIGATTAVWTVIDAVLIRRLPYGEPDRLMSIAHSVRLTGASQVDQYQAIGRLRPGVTADAAGADVHAVLPRLPDEFPGRLTKPSIELIQMRPIVRPLRDLVVGDIARLLWVAVQPGFEPSGVIAFRVAVAQARYPTSADAARFFIIAVNEIAALPDVAAAGLVSRLPLDATGRVDTAAFVEDRPLAPNTMPAIHDVAYVTPGYFAAMGVPLLAGRTPDARDPDREPHEVVVSRGFAERRAISRSSCARRATRRGSSPRAATS